MKPCPWAESLRLLVRVTVLIYEFDWGVKGFLFLLGGGGRRIQPHPFCAPKVSCANGNLAPGLSFGNPLKRHF